LRQGGNNPLNFYNNPVSPLKLGSFTYRPTQPLKQGESYTQTQEVTLPPGVGGKYYFYILTNPEGRNDVAVRKFAEVFSFDNDGDREDFRDEVFENPTNNIGKFFSDITYREPDLKVTQITVPTIIPQSGQTIPISWKVSNI
ncbi:MAG: hypothetical protein ACKPIC_26770, partial [Microcystis panniformis]